MADSISIYEKYNIDLSKLSRDYIKFPLKRNGVSKLCTLIEYPLKEDLEYLYIELNLSVNLISRIFNWNNITLSKIIKNYNIVKTKENKIKSNILSKNLTNPNWKQEMVAKCFESKEKNLGWKQEMVAKLEQTMMKKHGVKNAMRLEKFKESIKKTCLKRYGTENIMRLEKFKEKITNNYKLKTGYEYSMQNPEVKKKSLDKVLNKYGRTNVKQIHITHFEDLNEEYFRNNFIKNNKFLIGKCARYFNLNIVTIRTYKERFNINEPNLSKICFHQNLWLDSLNIINRKYIIKYQNKRYKPDGYDEKTNTIYEFLGDFWHGNPKFYNKKDINIKNNEMFGKLYDETFERFDIIKSLGYKIVYIWESDFIKNEKILKYWREKMIEY